VVAEGDTVKMLPENTLPGVNVNEEPPLADKVVELPEQMVGETPAPKSLVKEAVLGHSMFTKRRKDCVGGIMGLLNASAVNEY